MKQKLKDNLQLIIALAAVFSLGFGAMAYFAKASDLHQVEYRLEEKIKADKLYYMRQRLWQLYDRYRTDNCEVMQEPAKSECRKLKADIKELEKQNK